MRSTIPILICCLYALSVVEANPFSKSGSAEVQQGNAKAAKPLNFWSDDNSDDDDKDDKWSKDGKDEKDNKDDNDECASRSVSVLIGTSTYAIPCLQGDSIVNLNGLIPTPTSSIASSAVSSSAALSSEASSSTDSTTTTTDSTTTTTDTTTSAASSPTFTVTLYYSPDCTGGVITTSSGYGCFNYVDSDPMVHQFSAGTTSTDELTLDFYPANDCLGNLLAEVNITATACGQNLFTVFDLPLSYSVSSIL